MPGVVGPPDLWAEVARLARTVQAMAAQQQGVISDLNGSPVIVTGRIPGSDPPSYGYQFLDPTTHQPLAFFGYDGTDGAAAYFYDSTGHVTTKIDFDGFHSYDDTGIEQVRLGLLNASPAIYGLGVRPYGGTELQQVGGVETSTAGALSNTSVTSWTVPTGASTVTATIGPSGQARVEIAGHCSTGTAGQVAEIGCQLDGSTVPVTASLSAGASGGVSSNIYNCKVVSGLTPGSHTFEAVVQTANNGSSNCSFGDVTVTITPL